MRNDDFGMMILEGGRRKAEGGRLKAEVKVKVKVEAEAGRESEPVNAGRNFKFQISNRESCISNLNQNLNPFRLCFYPIFTPNHCW